MARKYTSKLRNQQSEQTRMLILEALAHAIAQNGPADVSIQEVADRAGVSHRTVYRYFPTRQALIEAMGEWVDGMIAERNPSFVPGSLDHLVAAAKTTFASFDEIGAPAIAMVLTAQASRARSSAHEERTRRWREMLAPDLAHLPPEEQERAFVMIRSVAHSWMWLTLHDEFGMSGDEAGEAVAWALRAFKREIDAGKPGPGSSGRRRGAARTSRARV